MKRLDAFSEEPTESDYVGIIEEAIVAERIVDDLEDRHELVSDADYQLRIKEAMMHLHDA